LPPQRAIDCLSEKMFWGAARFFVAPLRVMFFLAKITVD